MTQPSWAREIKNRRSRRGKPDPSPIPDELSLEEAADTIVSLREIVRHGNRRTLQHRQKLQLVRLLLDSQPRIIPDNRTSGFIRYQVRQLRHSKNLMAREAKRSLITIHDWHKDPELSDLATGAMEDIAPSKETWYL